MEIARHFALRLPHGVVQQVSWLTKSSLRGNVVTKWQIYILYILYYILYIIHYILYIILYIIYVYYILYIFYYIFYFIYYIWYICLLYIIYYISYFIYYILFYILYIFLLYIIFFYYILYILYYILYILYYILYIIYTLYYIYIYYMFGGFLSGYPWKSLDGLWKLQIRKKGFGGTPISGNLHLAGLMLVAGRICFFPLEPTWDDDLPHDGDIALIWPYCSERFEHNPLNWQHRAIFWTLMLNCSIWYAMVTVLQ